MDLALLFIIKDEKHLFFVIDDDFTEEIEWRIISSSFLSINAKLNCQRLIANNFKRQSEISFKIANLVQNNWKSSDKQFKR